MSYRHTARKNRNITESYSKKGMPFRQARKVFGKIVGYSVESGVALDKMGYKKLAEFSDLYTQDVEALFVWQTAVDNRCIEGGTARVSVEKQIKDALAILDTSK